MKPLWTGETPVAAAAYRSGRFMVVMTGADLPPVCIRCGSAPVSENIKRRFAWHHPALYFLIIPGLLIYAIVAAIVQKKMELRLPLCQEHAGRYHKRRHIAIALLAGCFPLFITLTVISPDNWGWWLLLFVAMLLAGAVLLSRNNVLQPKRIAERHGIFSGAHEAFLLHLQEAPSHYKT